MQNSVSFKNISVAFSDKGKGPAVVLLHGLLENSSMWKDIVPVLSEKNRVITIDLLGHGETGCLSEVHTMEDMAEAVHQVLDALAIHHFSFIGHSMGGYVALAYTEKYPSKVKGICLMNSTATSDSEERKEIRDTSVRVAKKSYKNIVRIMVRNLFSFENQELLKKDVEEVIVQSQKTPLQGYIAAQEGIKLRPNREFIVQNPALKTLQIAGMQDEVLWFDDIEEEVEKTKTKLIVFPDGHMSHIENKEELIPVLKDFIAS